jgi:hypothetical protein
VARVERQSKNQYLFRRVNERIAETSAEFDVTGQTQAFICECSHVGCRELVEVPAAVYGRVRDHPAVFLVVRGHEAAGEEEIVEDCGDFLIVRTRAETGD